MSEIAFTGGARIGWVNASWHFARLTVSEEQLKVATLGTYEFAPEQVVSIEPYGSIPLLSSGLRINHNRTDSPEKIVFWCMGNRAKVLAEIERSGFKPRGHATVRVPGFALPWSVVLAFIVAWNALFIVDRTYGSAAGNHPPGEFALLALLLTFGLSLAARRSARVQAVVLQPGHSVGEIKSFLLLLQIVSGVMSVGFGIAWLARVFAG